MFSSPSPDNHPFPLWFFGHKVVYGRTKYGEQLDCKEIQPVHSEGDQPFDFFGGNDAEAETPVLWPPHVKSWLIGKYSDAGKDWGKEEKGTTEVEMAEWHHWLYGCESEWTPGVGDGQGGLACCDSWGRKEWNMTEWLTELSLHISKRGRPNAPRHPRPAGSNQKHLDAHIPKEHWPSISWGGNVR